MECALAVFCLLIVALGFHPEHGYVLSDVPAGSKAKISDFPYQVSVRNDDIHICSGSIISTKFVLTAASCVNVYPRRVYSVWAGSNNNVYGGIKHEISELIFHPKFDDKMQDYNIALGRVSPEFVFSKTVQPVGLALEDEEFKIGMAGIVTDWGLYFEPDYFYDELYLTVYPPDLQQVIVVILAKDKCSTTYSKKFVDARMFCAGYLTNGSASCEGDSGGPLVINMKQVGITCKMEFCAGKFAPRVFTKLSVYRDWITKNTEV